MKGMVSALGIAMLLIGGGYLLMCAIAFVYYGSMVTDCTMFRIGVVLFFPGLVITAISRLMEAR